ncbi:hypothetical protein [Herbiconiux sp. L3-i23]|uniref:hypothetical protein n=1 Tax=Herbiconiux sp. L3-i23 TaxID=2905871 RepID=UPI00205E8525|nr:hypothetical protein [Herbiconiux sp. L3-i23]BDI23605.1 hypothetical protein L3i23_23810 [Herbiconiux sp. L3-i23]
MTSATVCIPWRPQPSRIDAFERVQEHYRRVLPGASIVPLDTGHVPFNLAACRNEAVRRFGADGGVVVLTDADTMPEEEPLLAAIDGARTSGRVHLPYDEYHWLGSAGSAQFAGGVPLAACEYELVRGACSGVYVTTASTWAAHGGQDERFRGWGYEDAAWNVAHTTLLGAPIRHTGSVYALHHVAETRAGVHFDANAALMERYRAASGDPSAMASLLDERSAENALSAPGF